MSSDLDDEEKQARVRLDRRTAARLWSLTGPVRGGLFALAAIESFLVLSIILRPWSTPSLRSWGSVCASSAPRRRCC